MLSSANYVREEGVLNSGEEIAPEMDLKSPDVKIYYALVANSRTHMPDGAEIIFRGGQFATANPEIKAFLDKISDKRGSIIYTKSNTGLVQELANVAEDAASKASDASNLGKQADSAMTAQVATALKTPQKAVGV